MTTHHVLGESEQPLEYTPSEMREWTMLIDDLIEGIHEECWRNSLTLRQNLYTPDYDLQALLRRNSLLICIVYQLTKLKYRNVTRLPTRSGHDLFGEYNPADFVIWPSKL